MGTGGGEQDLQCIQKVFRPPHFFLHFVMLNTYAKIILKNIFPSSIYTQYPIMAKRKHFYFFYFSKCIRKKKLKCLPFLLIIFKMCLHLYWSPHVENSIDWTLIGKAHTCLCKVSQLTMHIRAKTKPRGRRNYLQSSVTGLCLCTDNSWMEEVWNNQDYS